MLTANMKGTPEWLMSWFAQRSVDWWIMSEVLPDPEHRVSLDCDGKVRLSVTPTNPKGTRDVLATSAKWLTRFAAEGRLVWAYDPLHRSTSPLPFQIELFESFLTKIECPTLVVGGGPHGYHPED